jgi:hypothetical protein
MDRNRDLVRRFEEQTVTIRDMNREIVDMRSQLTVTHQGRATIYVVESLACSLECGRLEEQTVTIRDMNREIVDMRSVTVNCYTSR